MQLWPGSRLLLSLEFKTYGLFRVRQQLWVKPDGSELKLHYFTVMLLRADSDSEPVEDIVTRLISLDGDPTVASVVRALHEYLHENERIQSHLRHDLREVRARDSAAQHEKPRAMATAQAETEEDSHEMSVEQKHDAWRDSLARLIQRHAEISQAVRDVELQYHDAMNH